VIHVRRLVNLCSATGLVLAVLGVLAGPASAAVAPVAGPSCTPTTVEPFAAFGDNGDYFLTPGGSFENGAPGWTLSNGAALAAGNNTAGIDPSTDTTSLSLPAGSFATSPAICVTANAPTMRFFVTNTGAPSARLQVSTLFTLQNGTVGSLPVATVSGTKTWQPSPIILFYANLLALSSPTGSTNVSFQFRPLGTNGQWRIDDVYVDPFKHR
jgi:hypothetical protein